MAPSLVRGIHHARHRWHLFHSGQSERRGTTRRAHTHAIRLLAGPVLVVASLLALGGGQVVGRLQHAAASPSQRILAPAAPTPMPAGSPVLDQQQPVFTGGLSVREGASQTITVGHAGALVRVDLPLCAPIKNSDAVLKVNSTSANAPSVAVTVIFAHSYSDCAWYTFNFANPISANVGDVLTLTVTTNHHSAPLWGDDAHAGNPYPGGAGSWRGHTINDFAFKTYMQ